jgi:tRNA modification GTPase
MGETCASDTIAALATPPGRGAVGIVRISGPAVPPIAQALLGALPAPREARYCAFRDEQGLAIDRGLALYFPAPHSFTGEEILELQGHGGPVVMDLLLRRVLALGARPARPGEFSERAFLNDKLDLVQAEAVADLIDSHTERAARSAMRALQGDFSRRIHSLVEGLMELRSFVEAALDFPEEEIDFLADEALSQRLDGLCEHLQLILDTARQGSLLREGMRLVITGRPNVGKSTLLNRLAGHEAAIVSATPGTTRDVIHREIQLDGMPLRVIDTAGLRESEDPVEREGVRRAWREIEAADLVLLLADASLGLGEPERTLLSGLPQGVAVLKVWNKIDLGGQAPGEREGMLYISATNGAGLEALRRHLKSRMGYQDGSEGVYMARRRHLETLGRAREALGRARIQLREQRAAELLAEELRLAQHALGEITGAFTTEDLLGRIFSSFCIGK